MGSGLKMLLAGAALGLMGVFAFIGVKSILDDRQAASVPGSGQQSQIIQPSGTAVDNSQTLADQATTQTSGDSTQLTPTQSAQNDSDTESASNTTAAPQAQSASQQPAAQQTQSTPSTQAEAKLDMQLIDEFGGLQLTLTDPAAPGTAAKGQFVIRDAQDQVVASINDADTASFDLSPGIYEVTVIAKGKKSARMVKIVTGEFVTENFTLPGAPPAQTTQATQQQPAQQNQPQNTQGNQSAQNTTPTANTGRLAVVVQAAGTKAPLKSNIYVQMPNGTNVDKKNYADFADFALKPGTYKVTVKAQGKVDIVRNVQIQANGSVQEVFAMESPAAQADTKPAPAPEGTLRMALQSPPNARNQRQGRFVIRDASGQRVNRMRGVANAEVKLKPGKYTVIAVHRGLRVSKNITIARDKVTNVTFRHDEFPAANSAATPANQTTQQPPTQQQVQVPAKQGVLQLIAVSGVTQQPLKVNFMVSTLNGTRLKAVNNVSITELTLPPQDVLVDINYEDMNGQERITVKAGEPTVFTFTITPNTTAPIEQVQPAPPRSLEEMLLERLQQELFKRAN